MSIYDQARLNVLAAAERLFRAATEECRLTTAEESPTPHTGDLARSIRVTEPQEHADSFSSEIQATAMHASWTDLGTGVYPPGGSGAPIVPTRARFLRFYWVNGPNGPGVYFFRSVLGQPPQHWFGQPMPERWRASLQRSLDRGALSSER